MINNWKLGFKMLRHGYGMVMNIVQAIAFLVFGTCFLLLEVFWEYFRGGIPGQVMILCIGMLPVQMIYSLSVSNFVLVSPLRKKMQTSVPAVLSWGYMSLLYLVLVLMRTFMALKFPERKTGICNELVLLGVAAMAIMLYMGIAYKYFLISLIFLFPIIYCMIYMGMWVNVNLFVFSQENASFILAAAMGLACIGVGAVGEYLISLLVYKKPMSKMAQAAPLRKEL